MLINMIHEIQTMRLLLGEIKSVSGLLSHNLRKFEVEDTACFSLVFQSGAIGTFFCVGCKRFAFQLGNDI